MTEKITDNEIIKALEEFHHRILKTNLSYHIRESEMMSVINALDLINRKNARIKELEGKVLIQQGLIDRQKTEIEKLDEKFTIASEAIYEIEDALNKGSDNDWARETIEEYERLIAET